jgi:hypothetical protein
MTREEYRREAAKCICIAASKGMIETVYLSRPRKPLQSLTELGPALELLDRLVEHDMNRRQWLAVEFLSPEINHVVQCLRDYGRYEAFVQAGSEHLAVLLGSITTYGTEPDLTEPSGVEMREQIKETSRS